MVQMLQEFFGYMFEDYGKRGGGPTKMVKDIETAKELNQRIRQACKLLDESAVLVRQRAPDSTSEYVLAVARVFEMISSELLDPLYAQHPDIAPAAWACATRSTK